MGKSIIIPNGILSLVESKAQCPECERHIPFYEIEEKWINQDNSFMKFKCKCNRTIGITTDMKSDFIAFSLTHQK